MRYLVAFLLPVLASAAAIWPDSFGAYHKVSTQAAALSDHALWTEYGLRQSESARYESGSKSFTATAYRFQDPTGALGAFEWRRSPDAKPSKVSKMAVATATGLTLLNGNYLLKFQGYKPESAELVRLIEALPQRDDSALPSLLGYFPEQNLIPNSERYILGPAALEKFEPRIPPSTAAFHMGAEAQLGAFHTKDGSIQLAVFDYPTPQVAMQRAPEFQKIPGAVVKRSGPLIAVIVAPSDPDAAERLLSLVRYQASVTMSEYVPTRRDNIGDLVINAFILIGFLLVFSLVAGIAYGGFRALRRRFRKGEEPDAMIQLHLREL